MKKFSLIVFIFLLAPLIHRGAQAHGLGQSFEKEVGDYTVEFEYDSLEVISGEVTPYTFRLLDKESGEAVTFDSMFLRVETKDSKQVQFAGSMSHDEMLDGAAKLSIALNSGTYTFSFYFRRGEEELAEVEFEQIVNAGDSSNSWPLSQLLSFFVGGLIVYLALKIRKEKKI